jgi:uncharacterized membrane protein
MTNPRPNTQTGLQENVASLLCYVFTWVSGIVFYILENKNTTIRFHAAQSIVVFGSISIVNAVLAWIPIFGWIIMGLTGLLAFILWILLIVKAAQGGVYRLPVAAPYAEKLDVWMMKTFKF